MTIRCLHAGVLCVASLTAPPAPFELQVYQDTLAASNQVAEEVLSLSRVVRTFGTESGEDGRYKRWLQRLYSVGLRQATGYGG